MGLGFVYENMARLLQRSRRLLATCALVLLAVVVVLSAATRRPCLRACSAPWHTFKAGHMAPPELPNLSNPQSKVVARLGGEISAEPPLAVFTDLAHVDPVPPAQPIIDQIYRFRSPPFLA
jgi:hypothetical protein